MAEVDFLKILHTSTQRDYLARVTEHDKAHCAEIATQWGADYWDGERQYGYGGYRYDGRWQPVAEAMASHYGIRPGASILDIGCGRAFLLYELSKVVPGSRVVGLDISQYGLRTAKPEMCSGLIRGSAAALPFANRSFDFVYSITTFHNLYQQELYAALGEVERIRKGPAHITVETYRTEREKANLLYWQLTCRAFHTPAEWQWIFDRAGYTGDSGFIWFE